MENINVNKMEENTKSTYTNGVLHSVKVSSLKLTDFVEGFKFKYRGKPYVWMDKTNGNPICHNISLLEDELDLGYITPY
jgi:hypothetical protein